MPKSLTKNHFDYNGIYVEGQRSYFPFKKPVLSSFMAGMLVPMGDPIRVFPGTKLDLNVDVVIRSCTMVVPPLDGMFLDIFCVFVPDRIVWTHQPQFLGENDTTAWTQSNSYVYPYVEYWRLNSDLAALDSSSTDVSTTLGNLSLWDKYGLIYGDASVSLAANTSGVAARDLHISMLGARGYYSLWNFLFRDENYQRPVLFSKTDTGNSGEFGYLLRNYKIQGSAGIAGIWHGSAVAGTLGVGLGAEHACLMPVNKLHDAFTSVLPDAQYGDPVQLGLGTAPITGFISNQVGNAKVLFDGFISQNQAGETLNFHVTDLNGTPALPGNTTKFGYVTGTADLTQAAAMTINAFRSQIMLQRFKEALARGGRRVPEFYDTIYGVKSTDALRDYPELIVRHRYPLNVNQVVAAADNGSASGDWTSHLGDTGAYSLTSLRGVSLCEKDFTEFGYLHILYCVRADNRYSQAIPEHFTRQTLLDEYNPFFDHIGEVTIPNYLVNNMAGTEGNFGYQEAWYTERTQMSMATGSLNKAYGSESFWVLGEVYDSTLVTCTPAFLTFDPSVLNDIFVSEYHTQPQFKGDFCIRGVKCARMSSHSIPGIVGRI